MVRYGRRNIALLTIAPTGSVSICTQTTSGIEPAFNVFYMRRRKINPNDMNRNRKVSKDTVGDMFEEYTVFHPKFVDWAKVQGVSKEQLTSMDVDQINQLVEKSPYYKSTAADTDYLMKVALQGSVQKWVDHSISVTINLPENTTEETVAGLYFKAWEVGCKGMTVYREGSRDGVLNTVSKEEKKPEDKLQNYKRPVSLPASIVRFKNNSEDWIAFVGLRDNRPYEIFTGKTESDRFVIPAWVESGNIIKNRHEDGTKTYDFQYYDKDGYPVTLSGLSRTFNPEFWNYAKMISALLRHEIPMESIINIFKNHKQLIFYFFDCLQKHPFMFVLMFRFIFRN